MAFGSTCRGVASDTPYASKFFLSLCYLIFSSSMIIASKCKGGPSFHMPWWRVHKDSDGPLLDDQNKLRFDAKIFFYLILGGVAEFLVSLLVILSYFSAIKSNTNQGIGSAMITCNSVFVSVASWTFYSEKLSCIQILGIVIILAGVILIGGFSPEKEASP